MITNRAAILTVPLPVRIMCLTFSIEEPSRICANSSANVDASQSCKMADSIA